MPSDGRFTAFHRDVLLAVVALALLTAPLWVPATGIGSPTYTYERAEVVVDDEDGITYVNDSDVPFRVDASTDIACTHGWDVRPCAFERHLAENDVTVPTGIHTNNPDVPPMIQPARYRYAQIDGTVYEATLVNNQSVRNEDGWYQVDLALEPTDPDDALRSVSLRASAEREDVPPVVAEAAQKGEATSHREVEVPEQPLRLNDGTYYRVYESGWDDPTPMGELLRAVLPTFGPLLGLVHVYLLSRRFEVTHVGKKRY